MTTSDVRGTTSGLSAWQWALIALLLLMLQASILLALKPDGRGLAVVGDDAQSIYSFRAATVRNILDFPAAFSPKAKVVTLAENYRSTGAILGASNAVIGLAEERYTKDLWTRRAAGAKPGIVVVADEANQARFVADDVLAATVATYVPHVLSTA